MLGGHEEYNHGEEHESALSMLKATRAQRQVDPSFATFMHEYVAQTQQHAVHMRMETKEFDRQEVMSKDRDAAAAGYMAKGLIDGWRPDCWFKLTERALNAMHYTTTVPTQEAAYYNFGSPADMQSPVWAHTMKNIVDALTTRHARVFPPHIKPSNRFKSFARTVNRQIQEVA